jgi:hypothetical protein
MGRQIRFFFYGQDEIDFLQLIKENNDYLIDKLGNKIEIKDIGPQPAFKNGQSNTKLFTLYIANEASKICKDYYVDEMYSEIIEFWRSEINNDNQLEIGRIWYQTRYYGRDGNVVIKPEWLDKKFNYYKRWITKNCKISKDKFFYIGKEAYRMYKEQNLKLSELSTGKIELD